MTGNPAQIILAILMIPLIGCSGPDGIGEMMNADKAFSDLSLELGMQKAFLQYAADSAVLLQKNTWPIRGIKEIEASFQTYSDTGFVLTWEPMDARLAVSGDLGYTYGIYTRLDKNSKEKTSGKYVTIWEKQSSGSWKFVLDCGNEGLLIPGF